MLDVSGGSPRIAIRLARLNPRFSFEVMVLSTTMKQLAQRCVAEEKLGPSSGPKEDAKRVLSAAQSVLAIEDARLDEPQLRPLL